jgi:SAM-dependent methyltransferase
MLRPISALDFGCGSGRIMRWFLQNTDIALTGCDIHAPTIEWMRSAYPEEVRLYVNDPTRPLRRPMRASTSSTAARCSATCPDWAPWPLELRRVLKPGWRAGGEHPRKGPLALRRCRQPGRALGRGPNWPAGGELWGRLRDGLGTGGLRVGVVVAGALGSCGRDRSLRADRVRPPDSRAGRQAWVVARRDETGGAIAPDDLRRPSEDPRELEAALHAQWLAYEEIRAFRR